MGFELDKRRVLGFGVRCGEHAMRFCFPTPSLFASEVGRTTGPVAGCSMYVVRGYCFQMSCTDADVSHGQNSLKEDSIGII